MISSNRRLFFYELPASPKGQLVNGVTLEGVPDIEVRVAIVCRWA